MATIYYENDVDSGQILDRKVAVLGFGSQGHAHALNLRDRGVQVRVALPESSQSRSKAEAMGFCVQTASEATQWADVLVFCTPDVPMRHLFADEVAPHLRDGQLLLFAHGFNVHFGLIEAPDGVDVALVAPKGPGHRLRAEFERQVGIPALVAVHQDATGKAKERALAYAWGIGCAKAGVLETTFKEETETDLFGEQAVLCGGVTELVKAGFETLVEAGYQPEAAYFECLHELKLIVDLLVEGGLSWMRYSVSDTAEWGDYVAGRQVVNESSRAAMKALLARIQSGEFAREWVAEAESGKGAFLSRRKEEQSHAVESVGKELRKMMPFLSPKEVPAS